MAVNKEYPFTSLQAVSLTTAFLILIWTCLERYVKKHGGFRWAESVLEMHNFLAASFSLGLAAYVLDIGHNILAARIGYEIDPYVLGYLYHLLKLYEYFDIILGILSGNTNLSKYVAFSHLFLPCWSYLRIVSRPHDSTDWRLQVIADCSVRFLSRAVPWLVEDVKVEETILTMCEEGRWYPDLAISGFWAFFTFQGRRESEAALKIFGQPYENEATGYLLGAAVLLYAGYAKHQEDTGKLEKLVAKEQPPSQIEDSTAAGVTPGSGSTRDSTRQSSRKQARKLT